MKCYYGGGGGSSSWIFMGVKRVLTIIVKHDKRERATSAYLLTLCCARLRTSGRGRRKDESCSSETTWKEGSQKGFIVLDRPSGGMWNALARTAGRRSSLASISPREIYGVDRFKRSVRVVNVLPYKFHRSTNEKSHYYRFISPPLHGFCFVTVFCRRLNEPSEINPETTRVLPTTAKGLILGFVSEAFSRVRRPAKNDATSESGKRNEK